MMCCYTLSLATAGNLTTSGTPATETDAFFIKAGSGRDVALQYLTLIGKGAGLSSLSGLAIRVIKMGTASTGGTGITASPSDPGYQAAKCTAASRPSIGSTRTNRIIAGCPAAGPGGWMPVHQNAFEVLEAGGAPSIDVIDVSGTASLVYEGSLGIQE